MEQKIKVEIYCFCENRLDINKADAIIDLIERGVIDKSNYWEQINIFIKHTMTQKGVERWQQIASFIEKLLYN